MFIFVVKIIPPFLIRKCVVQRNLMKSLYLMMLMRCGLLVSSIFAMQGRSTVSVNKNLTFFSDSSVDFIILYIYVRCKCKWNERGKLNIQTLGHNIFSLYDNELGNEV